MDNLYWERSRGGEVRVRIVWQDEYGFGLDAVLAVRGLRVLDEYRVAILVCLDLALQVERLYVARDGRLEFANLRVEVLLPRAGDAPVEILAELDFCERNGRYFYAVGLDVYCR